MSWIGDMSYRNKYSDLEDFDEDDDEFFEDISSDWGRSKSSNEVRSLEARAVRHGDGEIPAFVATPLQVKLGILACDFAMVCFYVRMATPVLSVVSSLVLLYFFGLGPGGVSLSIFVGIMFIWPLRPALLKCHTWCLSRAFFFAGGKIPVFRVQEKQQKK